MASLRQTACGTFFIAFRFNGQRFERSLNTTKPNAAQQKRGVVERTIDLLKDGVLDIPDHCTPDQLWQFLRSGGKAIKLPNVRPTCKLETACKEYFDSFTDGTKEITTLHTERHHLNHLQRLLGKNKSIDKLTSNDIERYVKERQQENGTHGRKVRPVTIGKELQTIRQLWDYARTKGYVSGDNPVGQVRKPRGSQKEPFKTWNEIEAIVDRGGLTKHQIAELWDCLFLREQEIGEFLTHVQQRAQSLPRFPYIYPALSFCAYTGARRSEMFRCLIADVNGRVLLREKKRSQKLETTFREVPLHSGLATSLERWVQRHPGGQHLFCKNNSNPLDDKTAREAFKAVTKESKWSVLRGFHVFRHSFCSNLARHGVDQRKIDAFVGHQTDEQRQRYRHLFPEDRNEAIAVLSFCRGR